MNQANKELESLKVLFWNLQKNELSEFIINVINSLDIDIAFFAEYSKLNQLTIKTQLTHYNFELGTGGCEKILVLHKESINVLRVRDHYRYMICLFNIDGKYCNIAAVHLQANPFSDTDTRKDTISELVNDITSFEHDNGIKNTIVIGDFNASPFDSELTQKNMLNSVFYLDEINKSEYVTFNKRRRQRFYNPHLLLLSEKEKIYGSYHHTGSSSSLIWYSYDQILLRKTLVDGIIKIDYLKRIGRKTLLSRDGYPNSSISDHLPLFAEVKLT